MPIVNQYLHDMISCLFHFCVCPFKANFCNGKLEIYNYLFNQGIGSETAAFYVAWAGEYEEMGNNKKADAIYKQGIEVAAFPLEKLHKMHRYGCN